jgi:hypothetical protein
LLIRILLGHAQRNNKREKHSRLQDDVCKFHFAIAVIGTCIRRIASICSPYSFLFSVKYPAKTPNGFCIQPLTHLPSQTPFKRNSFKAGIWCGDIVT